MKPRKIFEHRPRVFISYRREDSRGDANHLCENLVDRFGQENVFWDIDSIGAGTNFRDEIEKSLAICDVLFALIGTSWATVTRNNRPRLHDPNDFVRMEIEAALARDVRVVPILVGKAEMPASESLPESLTPLLSVQALELSDRHWQSDLKDVLATAEASRYRRKRNEGPSKTVDREANRPKAAAKSASPPRTLRGVFSPLAAIAAAPAAIAGILALLLWTPAPFTAFLVFGFLALMLFVLAQRRVSLKEDSLVLRNGFGFAGTFRIKVAEIGRIELQHVQTGSSIGRQHSVMFLVGMGRSCFVVRSHQGKIVGTTGGYRRRSVEEFCAKAKLPFEALAVSPRSFNELLAFQRSTAQKMKANQRGWARRRIKARTASSKDHPLRTIPCPYCRTANRVEGIGARRCGRCKRTFTLS